MAKKTNNIPFIPLLDPREIDQSIIRNWHKVQVASLSKTVHVIESDINSIDGLGMNSNYSRLLIRTYELLKKNMMKR